jgi:hypothetical protein
MLCFAVSGFRLDGGGTRYGVKFGKRYPTRKCRKDSAKLNVNSILDADSLDAGWLVLTSRLATSDGGNNHEFKARIESREPVRA